MPDSVPNVAHARVSADARMLKYACSCFAYADVFPWAFTISTHVYTDKYRKLRERVLFIERYRRGHLIYQARGSR